MKKRIELALLLAGLTLSTVASAGVFKCTDASGKVSYQEQPCPKNNASAELKTGGGKRAMSAEDKAWQEQGRAQSTSDCIRVVNARIGADYELFKGVTAGRMCECTVAKLFANNPVAKIRAAEESRDREAMQQMMLPAIGDCTKELTGKS